jgi:hypothetical protein
VWNAIRLRFASSCASQTCLEFLFFSSRDLRSKQLHMVRRRRMCQPALQHCDDDDDDDDDNASCQKSGSLSFDVQCNTRRLKMTDGPTTTSARKVPRSNSLKGIMRTQYSIAAYTSNLNEECVGRTRSVVIHHKYFLCFDLAFLRALPFAFACLKFCFLRIEQSTCCNLFSNLLA